MKKNLVQIITLFLITGLLCFTISCKNKKQVNTSQSKVRDSLVINNKVYYLDSISESYYNSITNKYPQSKDTLPIDTSRIKILKNEITVLLENGDSLTFSNDTSESEEYAIYSYKYTITPLKYVYLHSDCWEWTHDFYVNFVDGVQVDFMQEPIFSPSRKKIVSSCGDLESGEMPNGIQLFSIENNEIVKVFQIDLEDWEPFEIKWLNDSEIIIKRAFLDDNDKRTFDYKRMKL